MSEQKGFITTITGPSCSGKSTLAKVLVDDFGFTEVLSTTTRPPRDGEVDGQHYRFVTEKEFKALELHGQMVESVSFGEHLYGGQRKDFEAAFATGKPVAIVVDPAGALQIRQHAKQRGWGVFSIWMTNPLEVLLERMLERFKNDADANSANYAKRLIYLLGHEIDAEKANGVAYDVSVDFFDERNDKEVAGLLRYAAARHLGIPFSTAA